MKILLFSDSHRDVETMCSVTGVEKPDLIMHLGDSIVDAHQLQARYPHIEVIAIPGNTDAESGDTSRIRFVEVCGTHIALVHGHCLDLDIDDHSVSNTDSMDKTSLLALGSGAEVILFGHTHEPYLNYSHGIWLMNPGRIGRISRKRIHATYGILEIGAGHLRWSIAEAIATP